LACSGRLHFVLPDLEHKAVCELSVQILFGSTIVSNVNDNALFVECCGGLDDMQEQTALSGMHLPSFCSSTPG
jgi:hypothetical protein